MQKGWRRRSSRRAAITPVVVRADTSGSIDVRTMRACEYAALQGARHVPVATEAAARRIYGDGVCVPAVRWIGREIIEPLIGGVALNPKSSPRC